MQSKRIGFAVASAALLFIEVLIALYVRDAFIRPYGGDILVTILLCCMVRIVLPERCRLLPLWIFLFSVAVEVAQYFDIVTLIGLGDIAFFRILIGTSFAWLDIVCYGVGCLLFWFADIVVRHRASHK